MRMFSAIAGFSNQNPPLTKNAFSIFIGAPTATSRQPRQRKIHNPGCIYRCSPLNTITPTCVPYTFNALDNQPAKDSSYFYYGERQDDQWLGASMDGGPSESDRLVVCAPRLHSFERSQKIVNPGICYWTSSTAAAQPKPVFTIKALAVRLNEPHLMGQQGFSVHVPDGDAEMLMGAPGVSKWSGSVVRTSCNRTFSRVVRRQVDRHDHAYDDVTDVLNPQLWSMPPEADSYFGYAVTSGHFWKSDRLMYAASAPRANQLEVSRTETFGTTKSYLY